MGNGSFVEDIITVKAETNCLAHALIIAIARLTKDPNYKAYMQGIKIHQVVDNLLATTGINLKMGRYSRTRKVPRSFRSI
jgi:hypothetical protein